MHHTSGCERASESALRPSSGVEATQTRARRAGQRLPTGTENVVARYRKGLGSEGAVKAGQLSLLMSQPAGVREVVNPLDARDGADGNGQTTPARVRRRVGQIDAEQAPR